jgi:hypothetical protein
MSTSGYQVSWVTHLAGGITKWYHEARQTGQLCRYCRGFWSVPSYPLGSATLRIYH